MHLSQRAGPTRRVHTDRVTDRVTDIVTGMGMGIIKTHTTHMTKWAMPPLTLKLQGVNLSRRLT
jgi:hypothetical protein